MWSTRIEAHSREMLKRALQESEKLRKRREAILNRPLRDAENLRKRREAKLGKPAHPETTKAFTEYRESRIKRAKASGIRYPSECPHCEHKEIIRAGETKGGRQRFRCRKCHRSFGLSGKTLKQRWTLMCHRCGSVDVHSAGEGKKGGRRGFCHQCKTAFTQGGSAEMDRNGMLLKMRVDMLRLPKDVAAELYQQAYADVLQGNGYCWLIGLNVPEAWKNARGAYHENGSGQKFYQRVS